MEIITDAATVIRFWKVFLSGSMPVADPGDIASDTGTAIYAWALMQERENLYSRN